MGPKSAGFPSIRPVDRKRNTNSLKKRDSSKPYRLRHLPLPSTVYTYLGHELKTNLERDRQTVVNP